MGLPGKRLSRSSKRRRASHFSMKKQSFVVCPKCEKKVLPHRACANCGTYKGREVLKLKKLKIASSAVESKPVL
ncbi:50S ribosomal protein L32 [Candidatus Uhrbacteria bacterium]|nr:50S ribosomal protein L32 [Candidatus Uhrbacteria bacterium]